MRKIKAVQLVLDFDIYPRNNVDSLNVRGLMEAMEAGIELPPVIICKKTKRVVDGFHRVRANIKKYGEDCEILCIEKTYQNESDLFLDSMRYNAMHGARLDSCDRARCTIIAKNLSIDIGTVALALHMPISRLEDLQLRTATNKSTGMLVALKRTVTKQFSGKQLTPRQVQANEKLSGMNQSFYVNQLIELFESKMIDFEDESLMESLKRLHEMMESVFIG